MKAHDPISSEQLLDRLKWRYATKRFDPNRKINADTWSALEEALVLTASSGGLQPWAFIVVTDRDVRAKLLPVSFGQPQITEASHLVVFAARTDLTEDDVDAHIARIVEVRGVSAASLAPYRAMLMGGIVTVKDAVEKRAWAAKQTAIALGSFLTSAALLGIDACPMEGFLPPQYDAILGLSEKGLTSVTLCAAGYRAAGDSYAALSKVRFPKDRVIRHV
jgi:nitroreductase